jgi:hypothetical protein
MEGAALIVDWRRILRHFRVTMVRSTIRND